MAARSLIRRPFVGLFYFVQRDGVSTRWMVVRVARCGWAYGKHVWVVVRANWCAAPDRLWSTRRQTKGGRATSRALCAAHGVGRRPAGPRSRSLSLALAVGRHPNEWLRSLAHVVRSRPHYCFEFCSQSTDEYMVEPNRQNGSLILIEYIIYTENVAFE